jgi:hypothetical protein
MTPMRFLSTVSNPCPESATACMAADHGQLCAAVHLTGLLAVDVVVTFKVFDLTGKLCLELGRHQMM